MTTLADLKKQIASLESEASRLLQTERAAAIAEARQLIGAYDLSARDLGLVGGRAGAKRHARPAGAAKYIDPASGKTWSGHGRVPAWIAGERDRDAFLADRSPADADEPPAPAKKPAGKAATTKPGAGRKAAEKTTAKAAVAKAPARKSVARSAAPGQPEPDATPGESDTPAAE